MSDERQVIEETVSGEVWWVIAIIEDRLPQHQYSVLLGDNEWEASQELPPGAEPVGDAFDHLFWLISVRGDDAGARVRILAPVKQIKQWKRFVERLQSTVRAAERYRRWSVGSTFERILDTYYAAKARGESPNLQEMARAANVKIGSLRQAKIRYDQKRREQSVSGETNTE